MILLDTHIWVWWVSGSDRLSDHHRLLIDQSAEQGIGLSVLSCWEVAKLVENGRLDLRMPVNEWIKLALSFPGIVLLDLWPEIAVESTQLPGTFHRDPADQIIVATARHFDVPLVTADAKIISYPHVRIS